MCAIVSGADQQALQRRDVPAWHTALGIGLQGPTQVVQVVNAQMHPNVLLQARAKAVQAQDIDFIAMHALHSLDLVAQVLVDERDLGRLGIVAEERQVDVRQARGPAMPDSPGQVRAKRLESTHPRQRVLAQGPQLVGLGVGTKQPDVLVHLGLDLVVARQGRAPGQTERLEGAVLGLPERQAFFHDQTGCGLGNFSKERAHGLRLCTRTLESMPMHIHILGICGTFMGGVAALAREAGHQVTGCDAGVYPPMSDQLRALGIELIEGFDAEQMALKPDMYVIGNVVSRARLPDGSPKFPLMEAILEAGAPYTSGPQWLAEHVLQGKHVLAVAGTHGKTTTTSMLSWVLEQAGLQPGFLVGGVPLNFGVSARLGGGQYFVIEADEYDTAFFDKRSKFVHYRPRTAILNNLEFDHADIFDNLAAIERQFHHLVRTVPGSGRVVVNGLEESLTRVLAQGCWSEVRSFGSAVSDFVAEGEPSHFKVLQSGKPVAEVQWAIGGVHNQLNALATIAAAEHVGVSPAVAAQALASFENVKRRMEVRGTVQREGGGITVYDDFAHHPTAIRTTVNGLRRQVGDARILAIFEPRSNTMKLGTMKAQLPWSLEEADLAFCHSGGLGWDAVGALAPMGDRVQVADTIDGVIAQVMAQVRPGDHLLCMSNGGFGGIHAKLLQALAA